MTRSPEYWGTHFPRARGPHAYWAGHFPRPRSLAIIGMIPPGTGVPVEPTTPMGAGVLVLNLEGSVSVTYAFGAPVHKDQSGREQRVQLLDLPRERYQGGALLAAQDVVALRNLLQSNAAAGALFQLGLPYEELTITADAEGNLIHVTDTGVADWAVPGQRALIVSPGAETLPVVVQDVDANRIALDIIPGDVARRGGRIMPTVPVYLAPQQDFARQASPNERITINAVGAMVGYRIAARTAILPLAPITSSGNLDGLVVVARVPGAGGNAITVQFEAVTLGVGINMTLTENLSAHTILVKFRHDVATVQNLIDAFGDATLVGLAIGDYDPAATLGVAIDEFVPMPLTGGADGGAAAVGAGATVTTHDSRPVWDRGLLFAGNAVDPIQSLTALVDLGGVPFNASDADTPDWGRAVAFESDERIDHQWFKLFLATTRGRQRGFFVSTNRADLTPVSFSGGGSAVAATLPLAPPVANSGALDNLTLLARVAGAGGNAIVVTFSGDSLSPEGDLDEDAGAKTVNVRFVGGVTTDTQIQSLINASSALISCSGTPIDVELADVSDEFAAHLYGGVDAVGTELVIAAASYGTFWVWYPGRNHLEITQDDGTVTYAKIIGTSEPGDGTVVADLDAALSDEPICRVSWLELCRFSDNEFAESWAAATASASLPAQTVR